MKPRTPRKPNPPGFPTSDPDLLDPLLDEKCGRLECGDDCRDHQEHFILACLANRWAQEHLECLPLAPPLSVRRERIVATLRRAHQWMNVPNEQRIKHRENDRERIENVLSNHRGTLSRAFAELVRETSPLFVGTSAELLRRASEQWTAYLAHLEKCLAIVVPIDDDRAQRRANLARRAAVVAR